MAQGKPHDRPNIVMGNDVHLVWNKGANYFEIEQRLIPLHPERFTISAEEVLERVDENTICVVGVLGTSYTFQYDPIEEINNSLVKLKYEKGLDIPLHVDGASGVFVASLLNPEIKWDFSLEQVKTINVSGHKFGAGHVVGNGQPAPSFKVVACECWVEQRVVDHFRHIGVGIIHSQNLQEYGTNTG